MTSGCGFVSEARAAHRVDGTTLPCISPGDPTRYMRTNPFILPPLMSSVMAPAVRTSDVAIVEVVERADARVRHGVGDAHREPSVPPGDAVGARVGPEVVVEGPVLLNDEDRVLDLVDAGRLGRGTSRVGVEPGGQGDRRHCRDQRDDRNHPPGTHGEPRYRPMPIFGSADP